MARQASRSPFAAYILIAFSISWIGWTIMGFLMNAGVLNIAQPVYALSPFACGPTIAGFVVSWLTGGKTQVKALARSGMKWRVGLRWYAFTLLSPAAIMLVSVWLRSTAAGAPLDLSGAAVRIQFPHLHPLALVVPVMLGGLFIGPLNEEFGWRGFALPDLQRRFSPIVSTLILSLFWGVWHLPLFFIPGMAQAGMPFWPFFVGLTVNSFFYTWVHNRTGGSVLMAILLHDAFNSSTAFIPVMSSDRWLVAVSAAAVALVMRTDWTHWIQEPSVE